MRRISHKGEVPLMASDFGTSLSANLVSKLVELTVCSTRYSFKFKRYFEEFQLEKENLESTIQSVVDRAEYAKKNAERIDGDVKRWLNEADFLIARVVELEGKVEGKKNIISCYGWQIPNLIKRYQLAKLLDKMKRTIKKLNNPQFPQFSQPNFIMGMEYYSSEDFDYFKNTKLAYEKLMEALKDDNISKIGLYAMGGSGKTSLVKQVGKAVEKLFDKVVFVVVSTEVNFRKIQGKIAGQLDYKLEEEEIPERARRLNMRLTAGEKILIILDDVWQILNFDAIGIPFGNNQMECKILLTTRREDLCMSMDCKPIPLGLLTEEEALTVFRNHAHITGDTSELGEKEHLAEEITKECKGLLIAIKPLAVILKGKALVQWEHALNTLRESRAADNIPWGEENPYKCLEVSFKMLRVEVQKFLLLCSCFGDDAEMSLEVLIRFAFGLDMFENVNSYKDARMEVGAAIKELVHSSLLFENEEQHVTMHDLVRDATLWVANKEKKAIIGPEMDLAALAERATVKDAKFLCCVCKREFPNKLDCPKLEFLMMHYDNEDPFELPGTILKGNKELKVLEITTESKRSWESQSTHLLTNLRCLVSLRFIINDMSFMEKLKTLATLVLVDCKIIELPDGLSKLHKLRLLDVYSCEIGGNPYPVLAKCSQLEELYFYKNDFSEEEIVLENLAEVFQKNNSFPLLQRYRLQIGHSIYKSWKFDGNLLTICPFDAHMITTVALKNMFQTTEKVCLQDLKGCKCIIPDIFQANECLKGLELQGSTEIDCLLDTTNEYLQHDRTCFPKMGELRISYMRCMKTVCCGPLPHGLFNKLKLLNFEGCPMLKYLFSPALGQNLVLLEQLEIYECDELKCIVGDAEEQEEIRNVDHKSLFPKLKHLDVRECKNLECLFHIQDFQGPLQLENLRIEDVPKLKYVIGECCHEDQFLYQNQIEYQSIEFPHLKELTLYNLQSFLSICPENYHVTWPSLQEFDVQACPELRMASINNCTISSEMIQDDQDVTITEELAPLVIQNNQMMNHLQIVQNLKYLSASNCKIRGIFELAGGPNGLDVDPLISCIPYLNLMELPELRYICKGPKQCMSFPHLMEMRIYNCRKLRSLLSPCIVKELPQLKVLEIRSCDQLQQIIAVDLELQNYLSPPMKSNQANVCSKITSTSSAPLEANPYSHQNSGSLNLCNLRELKIIYCPMLMSLFEPSTAKSLTSLENLIIKECCRLEYIIMDGGVHRHQNEDTIQNEHDLWFPRLTKLSIKECKLLKYIFPACFVHDLPELRDIKIYQNNQLEYIFGQSSHGNHSSSQHQNKIQIKLPVLEGLHLRSIPNLKSICPEYYYVTCSSLQQLSVNLLWLPNLSINNFFVGQKAREWNCSFAKKPQELVMEENQSRTGIQDLQAIQNLEQLEVSNSDIEAIFQVQGLPINTQRDTLTLRLGFLALQGLHDLRFLCKGPKQVMSLEHLIEFHVIGCRKLKCIFSCSISRSFLQLMLLEINDCDHLEQIVEEDGDNQDSSSQVSQQLCFPKLATIMIKRCNKLKHIFSLNEVPQLQNLTIENCSLLEKVFVCEGKNDDIGQAITFEMLNYLGLYELPNLIHICQKMELLSSNLSYHQPQQVSLTNLATIEVQQCHKLTYLFSIGSPLELPNLQKLAIDNCDSLEKVFVGEDSEADSDQAIMLPMLNHFWLSGLPELIYVCQGFRLQFQYPHCPKLNLAVTTPLQNSVLGNGIVPPYAGPEELNPEEDTKSEKAVVTSMLTGSIEGNQLAEPLITPLQKASLHEIVDEESSNETTKKDQQSIIGNIDEVPTSEATKIATASNDLEPNSPLPVLLVNTSHEKSPRSINGSVGELSTLVKSEVAASSVNSKLGSALIVPLVTSLHERCSKSIVKGTVEEIVPIHVSSSSEPSPSTLHSIKESVEVGPILEKAEIASSSIHSETCNLKQEQLVSTLHETSPKSIRGSVDEVPTSEATKTATPSNDLEPGSPLLIVKESVEELSTSVKSKMAASSANSEPSIKESVEVGHISEKSEMASSSIHSETGNSKQEPLVTSQLETSPKEFIVNEPTIQSNAEQQAVAKIIEQKVTQKADKPSGLAHMGPSNEKKTILQNSAVNFPKRTSPLISSISKMNAAGSSSSSASLILQPELLQELKMELDSYLNMPLEATCESNALENVERIVNSLASGTSDVIQRNILEDFKTRLINFKECVPQAMNTRQSSSEFISNYGNLNMELNTKLREGQCKVRDLESKLSEICEEEYAIEMEIQQLITRKIEIITQKKTLAWQLDHSTQEVFEDHEKWKAMEEELKLSTGQWLKAKEDLAHAEASWRVFKESLRL